MARKPSPSNLRRQNEFFASKYGRMNWQDVRTSHTVGQDGTTAPISPLIPRTVSSTDLYNPTGEIAHLMEMAANTVSEHQNPARRGVFFSSLRAAPTSPAAKPKPEEPTVNNPYADKYPAAAGWSFQPAEHLKRQELFCCGVKEIHGIQNKITYLNDTIDGGRGECEFQPLVEVLVQVKSLMVRAGASRPFWIFTDNDEKTHRGRDFAKFITDRKLGTVWASERTYNHNSAQKVQCFVWTVDHKAVAAWTPEKENDAA